MQKLKRWILTTFAVFAMVFIMNVNASAKEVTVSGTDIQGALDQADGSEELIVTIPAGTYSVGQLNVKGNTVIKATDVTLNLQGENGGIWINDGRNNVTIKGAKIVGNGTNNVAVRVVNADNATIESCVFEKCGIWLQNTTGTSVVNCTINNSIGTAIRGYQTKQLNLKNITTKNSAAYGIQLENDVQSTVDGCSIDGSALGGAEDHGEGLLVYNSDGTTVKNTKILNTKSRVKDTGNGIIVSISKNVAVDNCVIDQSGNHGVQVTDASVAVTVSNCKISNSGRMGISVSRGAEANLKDNTVTTSAVNGIVFDGQQNRVKGTIDSCLVLDTACNTSEGVSGVTICNADVTMKSTLIKNSKKYGVVVNRKSNATITDSKIYKGSLTKEYSVIDIDDSTVVFDRNIVSDYAYAYGILIARNNAKLSGKDNIITSSEKNGTMIFYATMNGAQCSMTNNAFSVEEGAITSTSAKAANNLTNVKGGVVIDSQKKEITSSEVSFTVSYPTADTSKVAVYVTGPDGNTLMMNAKEGTNLSGNSNNSNNSNNNTSGVTDEQKAQVTAFVTRLYKNVLNRTPDQTGLDDWVNKLLTKEQTGAEVAYGFFFSKEFQNKKYSDSDYVEFLYTTMMDRNSDAGGKADWLNTLAVGCSRLCVFNGFTKSQEFSKICNSYGINPGEIQVTEARDINRQVTAFVSRNYTKVLGRSVDINGLNDWCNRILNMGLAPEESVRGFTNSKEFLDKNYSNSDYVEILYRTCMDRDSDAAGKADWVGKLDRGEMTRDQVLDGFAGSQEFMKIVRSFGL